MTGYDILNRAEALLGISENCGYLKSEESCASVLMLMNQIATDLECGEIKNLSDELDIGIKKSESLCYGLTMLLSLTLGDSAKNQIFTKLYNAKRGSALSEINEIKDTLPTAVTG